MYEYKCIKCKGRQFSSSKEKTNEPCIYCGNPRLSLLEVVEKKMDIGNNMPITDISKTSNS